MLRVIILTGSMGLLLGSAAPPPRIPALEFAVTEAPALAPPIQALPAPAIEAPPPAPAPPPPEPEPDPVQIAEDEWQAERPEASGVRIVVSLPLQKAYVFEDGELLWTAPVSTGKRGHETPAGTFPILQKKVHHRSRKYDNAPMPYMQRLTWYGIALHAGRVPGYPASHGCIRLPKAYARKLYDLTDFGTVVTITRQKPATAQDALELT
jgi:lipoprotein-anchoring transpeptidase ErfK/SrfK